MRVGLNEAADYLLRKHGVSAAKRLLVAPPSAAIGADGQRGYEIAELDAWAETHLPTARGRGQPLDETEKTRPSQANVERFVSAERPSRPKEPA